MICQQCHTELMEDAKFCSGCGTPVPQPLVAPVCQQCQTELMEGARFCTECGDPVLEPNTTAVIPADDPRRLVANPELLASALAELGNFWFNAQKYKEALGPYTKAIELDPDRGMYYMKRGDSHLYLKQYELAIQDFDQVIQLGPEDEDAAYFTRGGAYHRLGQYERAIEDFDQAIRLDPEFVGPTTLGVGLTKN